MKDTSETIGKQCVYCLKLLEKISHTTWIQNMQTSKALLQILGETSLAYGNEIYETKYATN